MVTKYRKKNLANQISRIPDKSETFCSMISGLTECEETSLVDWRPVLGASQRYLKTKCFNKAHFKHTFSAIHKKLTSKCCT